MLESEIEKNPYPWLFEPTFHASRIDEPQHRYLFLTKNGTRYEQLGLLPERENFWYGTTRTGVNKNLEHGASDHGNTFLSIEPLLSPVDAGTLNALEFFKWVIVGAETGTRKNKVVPQHEWIQDIVEQCRAEGVPVFLKNSLSKSWGEPLIQEFPW
jgi:protein gp37